MLRRYVYYRVAQADVDAAASALLALAGRCSGVEVELLRRPGAVDGLVTLMEVHRPIADAGAAAAAEAAAAFEAAAQAALSPWIRGQRHVEMFEPLGAPPGAQ